MPKETTREKLIRVGHDLFYREGFLAVGLDRVINEVGISKQTFYNHFESKDDLVVAVIDQHHQWWKDEVKIRLEKTAGPDPRAQILGLFNVVHEIINDEEYRGCIFINAAVEFPLPHHPAHQSAQRMKADDIALVTELAERAGASDARSMAQEICILLEGTFVTQQVDPSCKAAFIARRAAETVLEKYLPATV